MSTSSFSVSLVAPGRDLLTYEAKSMRVPGVSGSIGILTKREALLASLQVGIIYIQDIKDNNHLIGISGGFFEFIDNQAVVVADELLFESEVTPPGVWSERPLIIPAKFRNQVHKMGLLNAMLWRKLRL